VLTVELILRIAWPEAIVATGVPPSATLMGHRLDPQLRDRLEIWERLLRAHAAIVAELEKEMEREQRLPLRWYEVLLHLSRSPEGRLRMQDLAGVVLQTRSGLSRLVDRMAEAGLVRRESCAADGRGVYAVLTEAGRARFRQAAPLHLRGIERLFARHLATEEARVLRDVLGRLPDAPLPSNQ
jgi:DNA-binding MarR family transcriptional regulator